MIQKKKHLFKAISSFYTGETLCKKLETRYVASDHTT